jgi:hypothetical protein
MRSHVLLQRGKKYIPKHLIHSINTIGHKKHLGMGFAGAKKKETSGAGIKHHKKRIHPLKFKL